MKQLIFIIMISILCSCNKLDGKIEIRNNDRAYLVNGSTNKTFKFTLKTTTITNDSVYHYNTEIKELAPGDEMFIGKENDVSKIEYPDKNVVALRLYSIDSMSGILSSKREIIISEGKITLDKISNSLILKEYRESKLLNSTQLDIPMFLLDDTIINGERFKYYYTPKTIKDTLHPYPVEHYKYKYEVTGQLEIKFKTQDSKDKNQ